MYDTVIIGGGLSGLLNAALLSKKGQKICILEKNSALGGNLQSFKRNNNYFDTGMHYFGSFEKGEILYEIFKIFGIENKINYHKLDIDAFDTITFRNKEYKFAQNFDNFSETLINYFPNEKLNIKKYVNDIKNIFNSLKIKNIYKPIIQNNYAETSVFDYIKSLTNDKILRNVIAGNNPLYAGKKETSSLYVHAIITGFFINGASRFLGGSNQLVEILKKQIIENSGKIITNSEVSGFGFEGKKIKFCINKNGEKYLAENFISTIHPALLLTFLETKIIRKAYRNRILQLKNTTGVFVIYAVMKKKKFPYINTNHYVYETENVWSANDYDEQNFPPGYIFYSSIEKKEQKYANTIKIMTYMKYDEVRKFENSVAGKRPSEYKKFKKQKAEKILKAVEKKFPGFTNSIFKYYTSTPLTFRDYTASPEGSIYGIVRDFSKPAETYIPVKTKIENLFLSGQNINLHGILGVSTAALLSCSAVLKKEIYN